MQQSKKIQVFKKGAVISILLIMAAPLLFTAACLLEEQFVKHEMLEKLESRLVATYTFSNNEIQWVEEDEELMVKGKMFDVKSFKSFKDSLIVTGIFDEAEDELKQKMLAISDSGAEKKDQLFGFLLQSLSPAFVKNIIGFLINYPGSLTNMLRPAFYKEDTLAQAYPIAIQPPKRF